MSFLRIWCKRLPLRSGMVLRVGWDAVNYWAHARRVVNEGGGLSLSASCARLCARGLPF